MKSANLFMMIACAGGFLCMNVRAETAAVPSPMPGGTAPSFMPSGVAAGAPVPVADVAGRYERDIKPIFVNKCFDCHSNQTHFPRYYKWPIVKQLIDHDIAEGREDLDFSNGYPFKSKKNPAETLKKVREEIEEGDMPPWTYRIMHADTGVTEGEKKIIFEWLDEAAKALK